MIPDLDWSGSEDMTQRWAEERTKVEAVDAHIEFPPEASLCMESPFRLPGGRQRITIHGEGATIVARTPGDRERSHVQVIDVPGTVIHDLNVEGPNELWGHAPGRWDGSKEAQHAFHVLGSPMTFLYRCSARNVFGDFWYVGRSAATQKRSEVFYAERFYGSGSNRHGFTCTDGSMVGMFGFTGEDMRRSVFNFETHSTRSSVVGGKFRYGMIQSSPEFNFIAAQGKGEVSEMRFEDITLVGQPATVIVNSMEGGRMHDWSLDRIVSSAAYGTGSQAAMVFQRVDGIHLGKIRQPLQSGRGMRLARFIDCTGIDSDVPYHVGRKA